MQQQGTCAVIRDARDVQPWDAQPRDARSKTFDRTFDRKLRVARCTRTVFVLTRATVCRTGSDAQMFCVEPRSLAHGNYYVDRGG